MPDCGYCEASFEAEAAYLEHLRETHADELGPIDRRRVAPDPSGGLPTGPLALGAVLLASVVVVGYVIALAGSGGAGGGAGPHDVGSVHFHGTMEMVVDGHRVDFSQSRYQLQADAFHFEANDGLRWHVHARGVTLAWAMDSLGIGVTADAVAFEGATYDDADPATTVRVTVDGEPVTPERYVLREGDAVRIVVEVG